MKRKNIPVRDNWQKLVETDGLVWHTNNAVPYWNEGIFYSFTMEEITAIEKASSDVYQLFVEAGDFILNSEPKWLDKFGIKPSFHEMIRDTWESEPPSLNYGRFDFGFGEDGIPKLFEFNCDTPTSLLEASVIQWNWKANVFPNSDQYNSIHESDRKSVV